MSGATGPFMGSAPSGSQLRRRESDQGRRPRRSNLLPGDDSAAILDLHRRVMDLLVQAGADTSQLNRQLQSTTFLMISNEQLNTQESLHQRQSIDTVGDDEEWRRGPVSGRFPSESTMTLNRLSPTATPEHSERHSSTTQVNETTHEPQPEPSVWQRTSAEMAPRVNSPRREGSHSSGTPSLSIWQTFKTKYGSLELEAKGSVARDHLALERTFLAWLRTSLAFASIGIAIVQLFRLNVTIEPSDPPGKNGFEILRNVGKPLGAIFVGLSIVTLLIGASRYFEAQHWLQKGRFPASRTSIFFMTFMAGALIIASLAIVLVAANQANAAGL